MIIYYFLWMYLSNFLSIGGPLEQFTIFAIVPVYFNYSLSDYSGTNLNITIYTILYCFLIILSCFFKNGYYFIFLPNIWQLFFEKMYTLISNIINDNFKKNGKFFFTYLFCLFVFVLLCNLIGLIPYTVTATAQLNVTLFFALTIFIAGNFLCLILHGSQILKFFLPTNTSLLLSIILVPIEIISYLFKPVALAVRLFANMMAGHTLLKVVGGFALSLMQLGKKKLIYTILYLITFASIFFLFSLEFAVALIQTYVFTILSTMYISSNVQLTH